MSPQGVPAKVGPASAPRRRALGLVVLALFGLFALLPLRGRADYQSQIDAAQQHRNQLSALIDSLRQQIQASQDREAQLRAAVAALDAEIARISARITEQQARVAALDREIADTQQRLAQARARLAEDRRTLAREVVAIYTMGSDSAVSELLAAGSFNEFWQKLINVRRVAQAQDAVVARVQRDQAAIQADVDRLSTERRDQAQVLSALQSEAAGLASARAERARAEAQLEAVIADDQRQLALAEQSAREVEAQIAALRAAQAAAAARGGGNGHFVWPEVGPITQGFGCTSYPFEPYDPSCPSKHFHSGIDIAAPWGTSVVAGDSGIAYTYVSSYGYGNHIIVVHGNGWVSIYGHLSGFAVGSGQPVARGQVIGYEGSTGNSSGPHLHFEIRLNDVPQDPLQYLP